MSETLIFIFCLLCVAIAAVLLYCILLAVGWGDRDIEKMEDKP